MCSMLKLHVLNTSSLDKEVKPKFMELDVEWLYDRQSIDNLPI